MKKITGLFLALAVLCLCAAGCAEGLAAGGTVVFGTYEQDNDPANGPEPIEWIILDTDGESVYLTSRCALDGVVYNDGYLVDTTWEECDLRAWLNSAFLNTAFTEEERAAILLTAVDNSPESGCTGWRSHCGNDTQDYVFLMSFKESGEYFSSDHDRILMPTAFAASKGIFVDGGRGSTWYWLRSAGRQQCRVATVSGSGTQGLMSHAITSVVGAVRPAIRVDAGYFTDNGQ